MLNNIHIRIKSGGAGIYLPTSTNSVHALRSELGHSSGAAKLELTTLANGVVATASGAALMLAITRDTPCQ